jgi:hypothetical protein
MFSSLDVDGIEVLAQTSYAVADARAEETFCDGAEAFTVVGGRRTWVCRSFAHLTDLDAATLILHEALHHAGLEEWPGDRDGPSSKEITARVRRRCGLGSGR